MKIDSDDKGFVVTYIPKSDYAPHQEIPSRRYYIRAGSNFEPTPHDVLAGMFGRRPQPKIKSNVIIDADSIRFDLQTGRLRLCLAFHICNEGKTIIEKLFTSILPLSDGGKKCRFSVHKEQGTNVSHSINCYSIRPEGDFWLPPGGWMTVAKTTLDLIPPFTEGLEIRATIGCKDAPPGRFLLKNDVESVKKCYAQIKSIFQKHPIDENKVCELVNALLGIKTETEE